MGLNITLNGELHEMPELATGATLAQLVAHLGLAPDRIALEHNGTIASREQWKLIGLRDGDRLEMVQFVGGGTLDAAGRSCKHDSVTELRTSTQRGPGRAGCPDKSGS